MIVQPSAMQRVASAVSKPFEQCRGCASPACIVGERCLRDAPARPAEQSVRPREDLPKRYSELEPEMIQALRIMAALEGCYPQLGDRNTRMLAGYRDWRALMARRAEEGKG